MSKKTKEKVLEKLAQNRREEAELTLALARAMARDMMAINQLAKAPTKCVGCGVHLRCRTRRDDPQTCDSCSRPLPDLYVSIYAS